ncbi:MAG: rRNA maturation RNase YbeY [Xanthobacteraceae bacterium]|nr:rRNA maturation RNase YbeY [Xanthobacteraceae bacterium]
MPSPSAPDTDILVSAPCWQEAGDCEAVVRRAIDAAAASVGADADIAIAGAELAVMLTDDAGLRGLNRAWRGIDKPTNVLSFPAPPAPGGDLGAPPQLGDIAIAFETTRREAEAEGKPFAHHLSHLAVHGFLHLVGYDHETDADAEVMEGREREILARLGIPDPYASQDEAQP